jgi:hypothetical protein
MKKMKENRREAGKKHKDLSRGGHCHTSGRECLENELEKIATAGERSSCAIRTKI